MALLGKLAKREAERLARAARLGFNIDAYHGTQGDIGAFDPTRRGSHIGFGDIDASFFTSDPKVASWYADSAATSNASQNVIDAVWERAKHNPKRADKLLAKELLDQAVYPVKLRMADALEANVPGFNRKLWKELLEQAKKEGRSGVAFRNTIDNPYGERVRADTFAVFDPRNIRSRFHDFEGDM